MPESQHKYEEREAEEMRLEEMRESHASGKLPIRRNKPGIEHTEAIEKYSKPKDDVLRLTTWRTGLTVYVRISAINSCSALLEEPGLGQRTRIDTDRDTFLVVESPEYVMEGKDNDSPSSPH